MVCLFVCLSSDVLFGEFRYDFAFITSMNIMLFLLRCFLIIFFPQANFRLQIVASCTLHCVFNCMIFINQYHACFPSEEDRRWNSFYTKEQWRLLLPAINKLGSIFPAVYLKVSSGRSFNLLLILVINGIHLFIYLF